MATRIYRSVAVILAIVCLVVFGFVRSVSGRPSPVRPAVRMTYRLVHAVVSQTAVYGDTIAWTQTVPPRHGNIVPEKLYASPINNIVKHLIYAFPQGTTVLKLAISKNWIVTSLSGTAGSSLWAFNRSTRHGHTVASWGVNSGQTISSFVLDADQVVYVVDRIAKNQHNGTFTVTSTTLPNGPTNLVTSAMVKCGQLAVNGFLKGIIAGTLSHGCSAADAFTLDPTVGQITPINPDHRAIAAFTSGTLTGWLRGHVSNDALSPRGTVILQNAAGANRAISKASSAEPASCKTAQGDDRCTQYPVATADLIAWLNGSGQPAVYDLATHHSQVIETQQPPSFGGFGEGYGHILTWPSAVSQPVPGQPQSWIVVARVG